MSVYLVPENKQRIWWCRLMFNGKLYRRSTKQTSKEAAKKWEAVFRTKLALGEVGIIERKPAPTLAEFSREFLSWAEVTFQAKPKTWLYYRNGVRRLLEHQPLAGSSLDDKQVAERVVGYIAKRQTSNSDGKHPKKGLEISSINRELQVLRRILHLAVEWGRIESAVKIKMLSGEHHRERVITPHEEARYLAAAPPLLSAVATVLVDSGLRPEECSRLRWENVTWINGRHGSFLVTHGKTAAARRMLPMTPRVRAILESRWERAGKPEEGWVWPAPTKSGHIDHSSLKKQHATTFKTVNAEAKKQSLQPVQPFVLYSLRHTFLTRLGASGRCDVWTLAKIAGHSSIAMSSRYVHPSGDHVLDAVQDFGQGDKLDGVQSQLTA